MSLDLHEKEVFFQDYADDVAEILKQLGTKWESEEQIDDEVPETETLKRLFIGYEFPTEEARGHVWGVFWYGATGKIRVERGGKAIFLDTDEGDYSCARIDIVFDPEMGEDFLIDGEYRVHSAQELKDRILVMWNADHWQIRHDHIEANAALYRQFVPHERFYKAHVRPLLPVLQKMGTAWGGEEQTDNQPEGGRSNRNKKWFAVGYSAPHFQVGASGRARVSPAGAWVDLWTGAKGTLRKGGSGRKVDLGDRKPLKRIAVVFPVEQPILVVQGIKNAQARNAKEMAALLTKLWRADAFGVRG